MILASRHDAARSIHPWIPFLLEGVHCHHSTQPRSLRLRETHNNRKNLEEKNVFKTLRLRGLSLVSAFRPCCFVCGCLRLFSRGFGHFRPLSTKKMLKKTKQLNCQTPCLLASLSFNMCEVLFKEVGMGRVPGTLLLRTISIQNPFMRYSFERAWYSFKKMSLSVLYVRVYAISPSQGTSILMENVADKITYYSQWTWPKWVVPYRLWRFSHEFEHPNSTSYYCSLPLILLDTH